jgi:hypothetical protein
MFKQNKSFWVVAANGQTQCEEHPQKKKKCKLEGNDYSYLLCQTSREETTFHLFFICLFSEECAGDLFTLHGISGWIFFSMMEEARRNCHHGFFMEVFLIDCWLIWKQRNTFIFNRGLPSYHSWKVGFIEAHLQSYRLNIAKKNDFTAFLSSLD